MNGTPDQQGFQGRMQRLEGLLHEVELHADPEVQSRTHGIVQALLEMHGVALARMVDLVAGAGDGCRAALEACADDEMVAGLLLLHGLHPVDVETRVRQALDQVRPALKSHGGSVELLDVNDGVVRLRLLGNCHGCPSSAVTMKHSVEEAVFAQAPEITRIDVEGEESAAAPASERLPMFALPLA